MIMDASLLFSDKQAVTATAVSTNVVDLGVNGRDVGPGTAIPLSISVVENFNNLTSLTISVETDDNVGFASAKTVFTSPAIALAQLNAAKGKLLPQMIPVGTDERYVRLRYTVAGTAPTLGKITAGVSMGNQIA